MVEDDRLRDSRAPILVVIFAPSRAVTNPSPVDARGLPADCGALVWAKAGSGGPASHSGPGRQPSRADQSAP